MPIGTVVSEKIEFGRQTARLGISFDYFRQRKPLFDSDEGSKTYNQMEGVSQGSDLGPSLCNLLNDGVLGLPVAKQAVVVDEGVAMVRQILQPPRKQKRSCDMEGHLLQLTPYKAVAAHVERTVNT